ncbi:uncharacterized protein LOC119385540 [Rhipicephalus sanguineus]|uniref:uncharacterized protein LOC119385540 n=1 Tax=Rhipicephalus sanguineus TaxID=34632 RepID=UPI0018947855|nr:uncharacterized protein LOC119385540 [Rhipicephalus sanguineus]
MHRPASSPPPPQEATPPQYRCQTPPLPPTPYFPPVGRSYAPGKTYVGNIILGMGFLSHHGAIIDLRSEVITQTSEALPPHTTPGNHALNVLDEQVTVPPLPSVIVSIDTEEPSDFEDAIEGDDHLLTGKKHSNADCLSRAPVDPPPEDDRDDDCFLGTMRAYDFPEEQMRQSRAPQPREKTRCKLKALRMSNNRASVYPELRTATKASPTAKAKDQVQTRSSSHEQQPSIGLPGAARGFESPNPKGDGARTLTDSGERNDRSNKKSPSRGSSVRSKVSSATSSTTTSHPSSGELQKSVTKASPTAKAKDQVQKQSSTQEQQPSIGLPGAARGFYSPSPKAEGVHTLTDSGKQNDRSYKKSPSRGSSVRSKAPSTTSSITPPHPSRGELLKSATKASPTAKAKDQVQTQSSSQEQQPSTGLAGAARVFDSPSPKAAGAQAVSDSGKRDDKSDKKIPSGGSSVCNKAPSARSSTAPPHPSIGELLKSKEKESSVKSERKTSEGTSSQQKEQKAEPFYAAWEFWKRPAALNQQKNAQDPGKPSKQSSTKKCETASSPKNVNRTTQAVGCIGLPSSSWMNFPLGWRRYTLRPEDILKLLNDDEPKTPRVKVPHDQATPDEPSSLSESSFKEGYEKFASPKSSELNSLLTGEATESSSAGKGPKTDKPDTSRKGDQPSAAGTYKAGTPASATSKGTSKYSAKSPDTSGNVDADDTVKDKIDLEELMDTEDEVEGNFWKKMTGAQGRSTIIAAIAVAALLVVIYYRRLQGGPKPMGAHALMANFPDAMYHFCESPSCKRAASEMKASVNTSVVPCQDLYSFACGKWNEIANTTEISGVTVQLSYMQVMRYLD